MIPQLGQGAYGYITTVLLKYVMGLFVENEENTQGGIQ